MEIIHLGRKARYRLLTACGKAGCCCCLDYGKLQSKPVLTCGEEFQFSLLYTHECTSKSSCPTCQMLMSFHREFDGDLETNTHRLRYILVRIDFNVPTTFKRLIDNSKNRKLQN